MNERHRLRLQAACPNPLCGDDVLLPCGTEEGKDFFCATCGYRLLLKDGFLVLHPRPQFGDWAALDTSLQVVVARGVSRDAARDAALMKGCVAPTLVRLELDAPVEIDH